MNLLTEQWVPVRPLPSGKPEKISLRQLLCEEGNWELCLPRDDMELAALQLLVCLTQALFTPADAQTLKQRIAGHLSEDEFSGGCGPFNDWFQVDHQDYPFMQVRGVKAKEPTPMDKLLAGLTGATNSCFVNQSGLGECLCPGCAAIALFNQASCVPSFGGGFKAGLRGVAPITTLVQGANLRQTIWLNVLCEERLEADISWYSATKHQKPTWVEPIKAGKKIAAERIGLMRGLLWQPAHIELLQPTEKSNCSCCGCQTDETYRGFKKAKFNFTVEGTWPHPHSPRISIKKKGQIEEKFAAFTTSAPSWTQLSRFVVQQQIDASNVEGQQPATVIRQVQFLFRGKTQRLYLLVGGYRNKQASILERRHEVFTLNHGWDRHTADIKQLVKKGMGYRDALYKALYVFIKGIREIKGAGIKLHQVAEGRYYRHSEPTILDTLARIDFENSAPELTRMGDELTGIVKELFEESVRPYLQDPELIRTLAVARRILNKHLRALKPQQDGGEENGTTKN